MPDTDFAGLGSMTLGVEPGWDVGHLAALAAMPADDAAIVLAQIDNDGLGRLAALSDDLDNGGLYDELGTLGARARRRRGVIASIQRARADYSGFLSGLGKAGPSNQSDEYVRLNLTYQSGRFGPGFWPNIQPLAKLISNNDTAALGRILDRWRQLGGQTPPEFLAAAVQAAASPAPVAPPPATPAMPLPAIIAAPVAVQAAPTPATLPQAFDLSPAPSVAQQQPYAPPAYTPRPSVPSIMDYVPMFMANAGAVTPSSFVIPPEPVDAGWMSAPDDGEVLAPDDLMPDESLGDMDDDDSLNGLFSKIFKGVGRAVKSIAKVAAPFAGVAANFIVPGSGGIVNAVIGAASGRQAGPTLPQPPGYAGPLTTVAPPPSLQQQPAQAAAASNSANQFILPALIIGGILLLKR